MGTNAADESGHSRPNGPPPLPPVRPAGPTMFCAVCRRSMPESAAACPSCGATVVSRDLGQDPFLRMVIPVGRSGLAVAAGYLGLFSLIFFPAPFALGVGLLAIRDLRRHPEKHGMGRAVFGVVMGGLFTLFLLAILVLMAMASASPRR